MTCSRQRQCWKRAKLAYLLQLLNPAQCSTLQASIPIQFLLHPQLCKALQDRTQGMITRSVCSTKHTILGKHNKNPYAVSYIHTFTEQEQHISQFMLWRGIYIPWYCSLCWDPRPHSMMLNKTL